MSESALLPNELRVSLQKIDHAHELISLIVGIKKKLVVAERTAAERSLSLRHCKDTEFCALLLSRSQKADSVINIERNPNSNFFFKLVTFKYTFNAIQDSRDDSSLHHAHAELNQDDDLHDISLLLHVEFV
jgi:hypothetical protein